MSTFGFLFRILFGFLSRIIPVLHTTSHVLVIKELLVRRGPRVIKKIREVDEHKGRGCRVSVVRQSSGLFLILENHFQRDDVGR